MPTCRKSNEDQKHRNNEMKETLLQKKLIIMASELGGRLFRNNVGLGWMGKSVRYTESRTIKVNAGDVLIKKAQPVKFGLCEGSSDTIGFSKDGRFMALETKTETGKTEKERLKKQMNFIDAVNRSGGIAGIVRTEEEGFELFNS